MSIFKKLFGNVAKTDTKKEAKSEPIENKPVETQRLLILNHLREKRSITSWDAITMYRITRLSAIIFILRQSGFDIRTEMVKKNKKSYALYLFLEL